MDTKKALFEQVAEKLIEQLENGTSPFQKPWTDVPGQVYAIPHNPTTGKAYKGINNFWLSMQDHEDPRWMTFKQSEAQGWKVRKGEKGTMINFVKTHDLRKKTDEKGKPLLDQSGKPIKTIITLSRPVITFAWVFNAAQIEGIPSLEQAETERFERQKWSNVEFAELIISNSNAKIKHGGNDAYYRPQKDYIQMPNREQFSTATRYYATLLHELGHWTGNEKRLDRSIMNRFGTANYAREELRAEISSLLIGSEIGLGHDFSQHAAYVSSWIKVLKEDAFEIHRASADAQKISDYLLAFVYKREISEKIDQPESKGTAELVTGQIIQYKEQQFEVKAQKGKDLFEMENLSTGKLFKLSKTDQLYHSLVQHSGSAHDIEQVLEQNVQQHSLKR